MHSTVGPPLGLDLSSDLVSAIFQDEPVGPWHFNRLYSLPPAGACVTYGLNSGELTTGALADLAANGRLLSAGSQIAVSGPGGDAAALPFPAARGFYGLMAAPDFFLAQLMSLLLGETSSQIRGSGGNDVGPFEVGMTPPPRLIWTNPGELETLRRGDPLELTWNGGDPQGLIVVVAVGRRRTELSSSGFVCAARAADGRFQVPNWITATLAGGEPDDNPNGIVVLTALPAEASSFSATGLDQGFGVLTSAQARGVYVE
jgi:hypothetical protein